MQDVSRYAGKNGVDKDASGYLRWFIPVIACLVGHVCLVLSVFLVQQCTRNVRVIVFYWIRHLRNGDREANSHGVGVHDRQESHDGEHPSLRQSGTCNRDFVSYTSSRL